MIIMANQIDSKTSGIQPFSFDTLSPDDAVRQARENGDYSTNATLGIEKELHILDRTHSIPSSHGKPSNQSVLDMYIEPVWNILESIILLVQ